MAVEITTLKLIDCVFRGIEPVHGERADPYSLSIIALMENMFAFVLIHVIQPMLGLKVLVSIFRFKVIVDPSTDEHTLGHTLACCP